MNHQRLLKLPILFLIPLALLALLITAADTAASNYNTELHPAADTLSPVTMRAISIPYAVDNTVPSTAASSQIIAMRAISIPFLLNNNTALSPAADSQIIAMRAISIPFATSSPGG